MTWMAIASVLFGLAFVPWWDPVSSAWLRDRWLRSTTHTCEFGDHCGRMFCRGLPRGRGQQLAACLRNGCELSPPATETLARHLGVSAKTASRRLTALTALARRERCERFPDRGQGDASHRPNEPGLDMSELYALLDGARAGLIERQNTPGTTCSASSVNADSPPS